MIDDKGREWSSSMSRATLLLVGESRDLGLDLALARRPSKVFGQLSCRLEVVWESILIFGRVF